MTYWGHKEYAETKFAQVRLKLRHLLDDVTRIRHINSRYSINNKLMPNNNHQGNKQKKRTMSTFQDIEMVIEDLKKWNMVMVEYQFT